VHIFGDAKKFFPNLHLFFPNNVSTASFNVNDLQPQQKYFAYVIDQCLIGLY